MYEIWNRMFKITQVIVSEPCIGICVKYESCTLKTTQVIVNSFQAAPCPAPRSLWVFTIHVLTFMWARENSLHSGSLSPGPGARLVPSECLYVLTFIWASENSFHSGSLSPPLVPSECLYVLNLMWARENSFHSSCLSPGPGACLVPSECLAYKYWPLYGLGRTPSTAAPCPPAPGRASFPRT